MKTIHDEPETFAAIAERGFPLVGLDVGTRSIGVAVSDLSWWVATPRTTIRRGKGTFVSAIASLAGIIAETGCRGLVIGLPKNMDGSEGPRCQSVRAFAKVVGERLELPVLLWDERLSTVAAERTLLEADLSRKRRKELIDSVAAAYILQGALDRIEHIGVSAVDG
ncbi:MAG: Holliday junction resolvase RuvX [Paracoccaceae bacterium]|nr:Holliday junction resolvase RuvX [Paracoccaceae bacterium]